MLRRAAPSGQKKTNKKETGIYYVTIHQIHRVSHCLAFVARRLYKMSTTAKNRNKQTTLRQTLNRFRFPFLSE